MNTYLLSRYTPNYATSYVICRLEEYFIRDNRVYGKIDKVIYKSKNYNVSRLPRYYRIYTPHRTRTGRYRIVGCLKAASDSKDELLEFNSDEEALLYFELYIRGEFGI